MASTDHQPITRETAYQLLSKSQRRHLLTLLFENERGTVDTLGRKIAARERDTKVHSGSDETYTRVVTGLVHCHIPCLVDHGLVEYDAETKTVTLRESARERFPFGGDQDRYFTSALE